MHALMIGNAVWLEYAHILQYVTVYHWGGSTVHHVVPHLNTIETCMPSPDNDKLAKTTKCPQTEMIMSAIGPIVVRYGKTR